MLKINISSVHDGEHWYEFSVLPKELDIDSVEIISDVFVNVKLYKSRSQISANVQVSGKFNLQCDRCLDNYAYDFENLFDIIYKINFEGLNVDDNDDDIKFISSNERFIDLKNDVRDYILLSVPYRKVPDDKTDVCSYCGRNFSNMLYIERQEEINPVWEKLLKVKSK